MDPSVQFERALGGNRSNGYRRFLVAEFVQSLMPLVMFALFIERVLDVFLTSFFQVLSRIAYVAEVKGKPYPQLLMHSLV